MPYPEELPGLVPLRSGPECPERLFDAGPSYESRHEREVLDRVTELRAQCMANKGAVNDQAVTENQLVGALQKLLAVVENYPKLKADQNFLQLQRELVNTEDRIQAARRFFNGNVRDYRNKCETFPSSIIAGMFGFEKKDYFNVDPSVREVPKAEFN